MAAPAEPTEFAALRALVETTFSMAWHTLVELRVLKSGQPDFEAWVATLPRSAEGLSIGTFWVNPISNELIYVTEENNRVH